MSDPFVQIMADLTIRYEEIWRAWYHKNMTHKEQAATSWHLNVQALCCVIIQHMAYTLWNT